MSDFALVFDKMLFNGYDASTLDVAEYGCCTRDPPSKDKKSKKGSKFECDPNATCHMLDMLFKSSLFSHNIYKVLLYILTLLFK